MVRSALALVLGFGMAATDGGTTDLQVRGTELQVALADRTLPGQGLIGAELELHGFGSVRIDGVKHEPKPDADGVWLYSAKARPPGATVFQPLCEPDPGGDTRLVFFQGELDGQQQYIDVPERFSFSCISDVQAKCLRWGCQPWRRAPFGGIQLHQFFCLAIDRQQVWIEIVKIDCTLTLPAAFGQPGARIFDGHLAHGARRCAEKMPAILEAALTLGKQLQVSLVHQRPGAQGLVMWA